MERKTITAIHENTTNTFESALMKLQLWLSQTIYDDEQQYVENNRLITTKNYIDYPLLANVFDWDYYEVLESNHVMLTSNDGEKAYLAYFNPVTTPVDIKLSDIKGNEFTEEFKEKAIKIVDAIDKEIDALATKIHGVVTVGLKDGKLGVYIIATNETVANYIIGYAKKNDSSFIKELKRKSDIMLALLS